MVPVAHHPFLLQIALIARIGLIVRTVYLDNNATTPVLPEVFEAMRGPLTEYYGNPSSGHRQGAKPAAALRQARKTIASFLGCAEGELVFTSCGTESNNIAILGALSSTTQYCARCADWRMPVTS